ncbi:MAG TPA: hypothetical protein VEL76_00775 [Gemmataceae bacterium]|nr:hypothetical protein [Gemmataceae bacterium]
MLNTRIAFGAALLFFMVVGWQVPGADRKAARPEADLPGKPPKTETKPPADADPRVREAVRNLVTAEDFAELWRLPDKWKATLPERTQQQLVMALLERLRSAKEVKLGNYADLFIPSRMRAGKMAFHGHGLMVEQDLFVESGRCAWAVEQLLGVSLPTFTEELLRNQQDLENQVRECYRRVIAALRLPEQGKPDRP